MKIALYVPSWPPGAVANGIVTYASELVPALRQGGHEVFVLTHAKAEEHHDPFTIDIRDFISPPHLLDRIKFKLVPGAGDFYGASSALATAVHDLVNRRRIDVFEIEETYGSSFAISRRRLLPVVVRLHGPWFLNRLFDKPNARSALDAHRERWEGRGIQDASLVTAPSVNVLQLVKDHYGFAPADSEVIANPIKTATEAETWNPNNCGKDSLLFVGRFDRLKGGGLVLRAFAELAESYPNLRLTFAGPDRGVIMQDGKTWHFEDFFRNNFPEKLRSRIDFCGSMKHDDVMLVRRAHSITIVASQYESLGYSVLEALSIGCPVVATAVGGIPEAVKPERNGLLVPAEDVNAMVAACRRLLDNPDLAARLGHQAWIDCREYFSPSGIAMRTITAYERAIARFRLGSPDHQVVGCK